MAIAFVDIDWAGRPVCIEHEWIPSPDAHAPLMVFLHEGLGSVSMWRDFPARLCAVTGCRGLVYSRPGYGWSTPRAPGERWGIDFMQRQATEVLPALLSALGIDAQRDKPWLFGHSDGGSIALLYAAHQPQAIAGAIVLAPHIKVEAVSVNSIATARTAYEHADLRQRLARYHADPDSAFWGWANAWLDAPFLNWSIESALNAITCPLLAIQGRNDEYGTLAQIEGIQQRAPHTQLLALPDCGHSAHKDQTEAVLAATQALIKATR